LELLRLLHRNNGSRGELLRSLSPDDALPAELLRQRNQARLTKLRDPLLGQILTRLRVVNALLLLAHRAAQLSRGLLRDALVKPNHNPVLLRLLGHALGSSRGSGPRE
jgi:hypothetical protein